MGFNMSFVREVCNTHFSYAFTIKWINALYSLNTLSYNSNLGKCDYYFNWIVEFLNLRLFDVPSRLYNYVKGPLLSGPTFLVPRLV